MEKKTSLVQDIYEISELLKRPSNAFCFAKTIIFFVLDAIAILFPFSLLNWPNLLFGLTITGFVYTVILVTLMICRMFTQKIVSVKIIWRVSAGALFLIDYVMVPLKTLCLISTLKKPSFILVPLGADWIFTLLLAQFSIYFLREKRPNSTRFFSVLISPVEIILLSIYSIRALACSFLLTGSNPVLSQVVRFVLLKICGIISISTQVRFKPFFCPLAERTFATCVLLSSMITGAFCLLTTIEGALKFLIVVGPFAFVITKVFLGIETSPEFIPFENSSLCSIKNLLLGKKIEGQLSGNGGKMRDHMLLHRKLVMIFAKSAKANIKNTFTQGSLAVFKSMTSPTFQKTSDQKTSDNKDESKSTKKLTQTHSQTINIPAPSVFSRKGDEDQSKTKEASYLDPSGATLIPVSETSKKEPQVILPEADKILEDLIVENYLGGERVGYEAYLYLIWILDHKLSLGKILHLLSVLKNHRLRFRKVLFFYEAKREVEKKLTEILHQAKEETKAAHRHLLAKRNLAASGQHGSKSASVHTSDIMNTVVEHVDITEAFYLKSKLKTLSENIKLYSKINTEYIDQLILTNQDLYQRSLLMKHLWSMDQQISEEFKALDEISQEQNFQHLIPYFYHVFLNSNRHWTASKVKSDINKRFRSMKATHARHLKKVSQVNYLNECLLLTLDSQRNKFGTILDIYGKAEMMLDDPLELVGNSYTVFMNESLKGFHDQLASFIYDDNLSGNDNFNMTLSRPGFIKVPFRSIILPSMIKVKICPFHSAHFKFVAALKPDFADDKLYIALDDLLRIDGYSATFLPVIKEEYLRKDLPLQMVSSNVYTLITNYSHLESDIGKSKLAKEKLSKKRFAAKTPIRHQLENKTANFFIEDAKSNKSVLNSIHNSGGRSDNPTQSDMTREIVLDERLQFFNTTDNTVEPIKKSFKILLKYHQYPNKCLKANQPKGYWYMCLTPNSEQGVFGDLQYITQTDHNEIEHSLSPTKNKNKPNNSPSEGNFLSQRI